MNIPVVSQLLLHWQQDWLSGSEGGKKKRLNGLKNFHYADSDNLSSQTNEKISTLINCWYPGINFSSLFQHGICILNSKSFPCVFSQGSFCTGNWQTLEQLETPVSPLQLDFCSVFSLLTTTQTQGSKIKSIRQHKTSKHSKNWCPSPNTEDKNAVKVWISGLERIHRILNLLKH